MHLQCQLLELGQQVVRLLAQALAILLHASRCLVEFPSTAVATCN